MQHQPNSKTRIRESLVESEFSFWHKISELFNHTMSNK